MSHHFIDNLNILLDKIIEQKFSHVLLVLADFNYPMIDWTTISTTALGLRTTDTGTATAVTTEPEDKEFKFTEKL